VSTIENGAVTWRSRVRPAYRYPDGAVWYVVNGPHTVGWRRCGATAAATFQSFTAPTGGEPNTQPTPGR
jgi:hypothetical protein